MMLSPVLGADPGSCQVPSIMYEERKFSDHDVYKYIYVYGYRLYRAYSVYRVYRVYRAYRV